MKYLIREKIRCFMLRRFYENLNYYYSIMSNERFNAMVQCFYESKNITVKFEKPIDK